MGAFHRINAVITAMPMLVYWGYISITCKEVVGHKNKSKNEEHAIE